MSGAQNAPSSVRKRKHIDVMEAVDYHEIVCSLPAQTVYDILVRAAQQYLDVAQILVDEHQKIVAAEQGKTFDFDSYSKDAWKALNMTYNCGSGSQQYEKASDAGSEIREYISTIGKSTPAHASFGTKKSALETLRKIGKSISLSTDTLGHEVRVQFQYDDCLEETMLRIAKGMKMEERKAFMTQEFVDKLVELQELSKVYCHFMNLKGVRLSLLGAK